MIYYHNHDLRIVLTNSISLLLSTLPKSWIIKEQALINAATHSLKYSNCKVVIGVLIFPAKAIFA